MIRSDAIATQPKPVILSNSFTVRKSNLTLDEIVGQDEAICELKKLVNSIRFKPLHSMWNMKPPKGILLIGPTGVGKSESFRALAGELGNSVELVTIRYLDIASRFMDAPIEALRPLFHMIEEKSKTKHVLVFIDEISSMLPTKTSELHEVTTRRVNVFLEWLDGGFHSLDNVTVIGADNNVEAIEPAARRPGRFDKIIMYNDLKPADMVRCFGIHMGKRSLHDYQLNDINWDSILPLLKKGSLIGADIPIVINRVLENKVEEHRNIILNKFFDFNMLDADEQRNIMYNQRYYPDPVNTQDMFTAVSDYIQSKYKIGSLAKTSSMGFQSENIEIEIPV